MDGCNTISIQTQVYRGDICFVGGKGLDGIDCHVAMQRQTEPHEFNLKRLDAHLLANSIIAKYLSMYRAIHTKDTLNCVFVFNYLI